MQFLESICLATLFLGVFSLPHDDRLTVKTVTDTFTGLQHPAFQKVRQFLNNPYAQPPIEDRRWLPPVRLPESTSKQDTTSFGLVCSQFISGGPTIWSNWVPQFLPTYGSVNETAAIKAPTSGGDCLNLAIWTPTKATIASRLPVVMFIPGGKFTTEGVTVPYQLPGQWVHRSQEHIVVTINYRVNIMGFPNAASLSSQNLGVFDTRAAVEWLSENIAAFGGDPERIIIWGQSAGSSAGLIMMSDTALEYPPAALNSSGFSGVAQELGDYVELYLQKKVSPIPAIIGNCANEGAGLVDYPVGHVLLGPSQALMTEQTLSGKLCPAANSSYYRLKAGVSTYRYQYAGYFSNISPLRWMGAFHGSDMPMVFGTYSISRGGGSAFEALVSEKIQDYFLEFIKDPVQGPKNAGWPAFDPSAEHGGLMLRFAADRKPVQFVSGNIVDGECLGLNVTYSPFP
ncbi:hypothetical protein N7507_005302 [Penicillium longicatenatum]|nr:hypothetical protein N7507_005302 [Penicillium longicatenatum]